MPVSVTTVKRGVSLTLVILLDNSAVNQFFSGYFSPLEGNSQLSDSLDGLTRPANAALRLAQRRCRVRQLDHLNHGICSVLPPVAG